MGSSENQEQLLMDAAFVNAAVPSVCTYISGRHWEIMRFLSSKGHQSHFKSLRLRRIRFPMAFSGLLLSVRVTALETKASVSFYTVLTAPIKNNLLY